jgi:hypothetical protein
VKILVRVGLLVTLLFAAFSLFSFDPVTRFNGKVTAISEDSVTLDPGGVGEPITLELVPSTIFIQSGRSASWRDVKIGARAEARATTNENGVHALNLVFENPPFHIEPSPADEALIYYACLLEFPQRKDSVKSPLSSLPAEKVASLIF